MALIGLVRVSTDGQKTQRQHDALDPICLQVVEEKASGKLATGDRPDLLHALSYVREGDLLTVQEVDRLGRNLLEGLIVLNDLFQQGVGVKVLEGIAAGEHTERSFILDLALALAEDRRRDIVRKTRDGLQAARAQGRVGGRRPVVDDDKRAAILDRRRRGESIRTIAAGVKVSVGVVHNTLTAAAQGDDQTPPPSPAAAEPVDQDHDVEQDRDVGDADPVGGSGRGLETLGPAAAVALVPSSAPATEPVDQVVEVGQDVDQGGDVQTPRMAASSAPVDAGPRRRRVIDLAAEHGPGWQLVEQDDPYGSTWWQLQHHGVFVAAISQAGTVRGRRGWQAVRVGGEEVRAFGSLAVTKGSRLWRTRDLAVAGAVDHLKTHPAAGTGTRGPDGALRTPPAALPAAPDVDQACDEAVPQVRPDPRTAKARAVWDGLNDRQRAYLEVIYQDDQAQESWISKQAAQGHRTPPADVWRWRPYNAVDAPIHRQLARRRMVDPGAGSTLKALTDRGLLLTRGTSTGLGEVVEVRLTTQGRAVARAGLGVTRSSRPKGLLSKGLWRQLVMAVTAEQDGQPLHSLWRQTHLYLGTGYTLRGHPSRGYLVERKESGRPYSSRWYLTDTGRAHLLEHLDAYRQTYPDVDVTGLQQALAPAETDPRS